jgi:hypothetical protein
MHPRTLSAFVDELVKAAGAMAAFAALDRAGQMAGAGVGRGLKGLSRPPRVGTFGVRTYAPKLAEYTQPGVVNADSKTTAEEYVAPEPRPLRRKQAAEKMDRESWKQTAKDLPVVIAGTGLGYGLGRTLAEEVGKRTAKKVVEGGKPPGWLKHVPLATSLASSASSYAFGRSREALRKRREEARSRK